MSDVEKAEALIASLEAKRVAHVEKGVALADERASIAYKVHADADPKARARLTDINKEIVAHASENESIGAAIKEAHDRLAKARQHEAREADRKNAVEARKMIDALAEHGAIADDALHDLIEAGNNLKVCFDRLIQLGFTHPSFQMLSVHGNLALLAGLQKSVPWKRHFQTIAPHERATFAELIAAWQKMLLQEIERRLGETVEQKEAAA